MKRVSFVPSVQAELEMKYKVSRAQSLEDRHQMIFLQICLQLITGCFNSFSTVLIVLPSVSGFPITDSWSALSLRCASLTQNFQSTLSEFCLLKCLFALPYLLTVNILKTFTFSHFFLSSYIFSLEEHIYYFMSTDIFVQIPKSPPEFCFSSSTCQLDTCNWIGLSNLINFKPHTSLNPQTFVLILQVLLMARLYSVSWVLKMEVAFYFAFSFLSHF